MNALVNYPVEFRKTSDIAFLVGLISIMLFVTLGYLLFLFGINKYNSSVNSEKQDPPRVQIYV